MITLYSLLGSFIGFLVTTLYYRVVVLPRERQDFYYQKAGKNMNLSKQSTKKQDKSSKSPSITIYGSEKKSVTKALFDMDELLEESNRIYQKTENLKQSIRKKLISRSHQV